MKLSEELVTGLYKEICQRRDYLLLTLGFICFFFFSNYIFVSSSHSHRKLLTVLSYQERQGLQSPADTKTE